MVKPFRQVKAVVMIPGATWWPIAALLVAGSFSWGWGHAAHAIQLKFDYQFDSGGFFQVAERRAALEVAGDFFARITDDLSPIIPGGPLNSSEFNFNHPGTDELITVNNLVIPENTVIIYVGGRELPGSTIGFGGPAGWSANGTATFLETASRRGQAALTLGPTATEYQVAVGVMTFDTTATWNFQLAGPVAGRDDFLTVAMHELGHILGYGTSDSWFNKVDESALVFRGPAAQAIQGSPVRVAADLAHWQSKVQSTVGGVPQATALDPTIQRGTREYYTALDIAGLTDIGWEWGRDGDADLDGDVDSSDLLIFLEGWTGSLDRFTGGKSFIDGDSDFDGDVDSSDLLNVVSSWTGANSGRTVIGVPEPNSLGITSLCAAGWFSRRRRQCQSTR